MVEEFNPNTDKFAAFVDRKKEQSNRIKTHTEGILPAGTTLMVRDKPKVFEDPIRVKIYAAWTDEGSYGVYIYDEAGQIVDTGTLSREESKKFTTNPER